LLHSYSEEKEWTADTSPRLGIRKPVQIVPTFYDIHRRLGAKIVVASGYLEVKNCQEGGGGEGARSQPLSKNSTLPPRLTICPPLENKKLSWCWQTHATRLVVRQGHQTEYHSIPYVRYSFLLCNSNIVFKTRHFSDILLQKMSWPWNTGQRWLKVIESGTIR